MWMSPVKQNSCHFSSQPKKLKEKEEKSPPQKNVVQIHSHGLQGLRDKQMRLPLPYTPHESRMLSPPTSGGSCSSSTRPPRPPGSWPCTWRDPWRSPTRSTSCRSPCTAH